MSNINKKYKEKYVVEFDAKSKVDEFSGTAKSGKDFTMIKQSGWLHDEDDQYPVKVEVMIDDALKPYAEGFYKIINPLSVGGYGALTVNRDISFEKLND